jgi:hypothetical protein
MGLSKPKRSWIIALSSGVGVPRIIISAGSSEVSRKPTKKNKRNK